MFSVGMPSNSWVQRDGVKIPRLEKEESGMAEVVLDMTKSEEEGRSESVVQIVSPSLVVM